MSPLEQRARAWLAGCGLVGKWYDYQPALVAFLSSVAAEAEQRGAAAERARVVEWLRARIEEPRGPSGYELRLSEVEYEAAQLWADGIARGEHLPTREGAP